METSGPATTFELLGRKVVAVADLHGHLTVFKKLLGELDKDLGHEYVLVTLGDYVDNGNEIRELLEFLIGLKEERGDRFFPVLGNHDLACLRALGWPTGKPDLVWFNRWASRYWNPGKGTPQQYGASSAIEFKEKFNNKHYTFLSNLPWFVECEGFFFVHAGLEKGPLAPQRELLRARKPLEGTDTQPQLRNKDLAVVNDHEFEGIVVSGHTKAHKMGSGNVTLSPYGNFADSKRITLNSNIEGTGVLNYVILPDRTFGIQSRITV